MCTVPDCVQKLQELKIPQTSKTPDYGGQGAVRIFVRAPQHCGQPLEFIPLRPQSLFAVTTSEGTANLYGHGFLANLVECVLFLIVCRSSRN